MPDKKIRVLVADDSVVIRRVLTSVLGSDPRIEVVGVAAHGRIALAQIDQLAPDAVILDIEMPEMDGLQTLKAIRIRDAKIPVIMFSTITERGAAATLDAFAAGASDYVTKPASCGSLNGSMDEIREQLIPKIVALCSPRLPLSSLVSAVTTKNVGAPSRKKPGAQGPIEVVAMGSSTGGPNVLSEMLPAIPRDFPAAILVVQHMPPVFTRMFAERLNTRCAICVCEAVSGQSIEPGTAYIAPGDFHMSVARNGAALGILLCQSRPENSCRPSVDVLFRSVAETYAGRALAVVLTGMGQDGLRGCESLHEAGAAIIVQNELSSVVWGMPGFIAKAGLAEEVLPPSELTAEILKRVRDTGASARRFSAGQGASL